MTDRNKYKTFDDIPAEVFKVYFQETQHGSYEGYTPEDVVTINKLEDDLLLYANHGDGMYLDRLFDMVKRVEVVSNRDDGGCTLSAFIEFQTEYKEFKVDNLRSNNIEVYLQEYLRWALGPEGDLEDLLKKVEEDV